MGGGLVKGGPEGWSWFKQGKCYSISGSVSNSPKIINRVFIAGLLCGVRPVLSARSQQWLMAPMCWGRRGCSVGVYRTARIGMGSLTLLPQVLPLTNSCPVSAYRSQCVDTAGALVSHSFYLKKEVFNVTQIHICQHTDTYTDTDVSAEIFWSWWAFIQQVDSHKSSLTRLVLTEKYHL